MSNTINLIGVSGRIKSGKDTFCQTFQRISFEKSTKVWENKKFAYQVKSFASILTGIPVEDFEKQEVKDSLLSSEWSYLTEIWEGKRPFENFKGEEMKLMTVREMLIRIGNGCREVVHPDIWVNALFKDSRQTLILKDKNIKGGSILDLLPEKTEKSNWLISDCRYPNEVDRIKKEGGIIVRINSSRSQIIDHISETALNNYEFDYVIDNSGTMLELEEKIFEFGIKFKIWK